MTNFAGGERRAVFQRPIVLTTNLLAVAFTRPPRNHARRRRRACLAYARSVGIVNRRDFCVGTPAAKRLRLVDSAREVPVPKGSRIGIYSDLQRAAHGI